MRNDNLQDYNEVLSTISTCLSQYNAEYCVIAGDFNTDLSRVNSCRKHNKSQSIC